MRVVLVFISLCSSLGTGELLEHHSEIQPSVGQNHLEEHDEKILHTFHTYIEIQTKCCLGLQDIRHWLKVTTDVEEFKVDIVDLRDKVTEAQLMVCDLVERTSAQMNTWLKLRKTPMYFDFVMTGYVEEIEFALKDITDTGQKWDADMDEAVRLVREVVIMLPPTPETEESKPRVDYTDLGFWLQELKQLIYPVAIETYLLALTVVIIIIHRGTTWQLIGKIVILMAVFSLTLKYSESTEGGHKDTYPMQDIIGREVAPFTHTNWRQLPMSNGTWSQTILYHNLMISTSRAFEELIQGFSTNFPLVTKYQGLTRAMKEVQDHSLIVSSDYSQIQRDLDRLAKDEKKIGNMIIDYLEETFRFMEDMLDIFKADMDARYDRKL